MALRDGLKKVKNRRGVYYKEHQSRKLGVRKDRLFILRYKIEGKEHVETLGWESSGMTELTAEVKLAELKANAKGGMGPTSLAAEREAKKVLLEAKLEEDRRQEEQRLLVERKTATFDQFWKEYYYPDSENRKKRHL